MTEKMINWDPVDSVRTWLRRRRRGQAARSGIPYWLVKQGYRFFVPVIVLFFISVLFVGWRDAYGVITQMDSPWEIGYVFITLPLSLSGWLIVTGFTGALAGFVVVEVTNNRRGRLADQPSRRGGDQIPLLYTLEYRRHGHDIPEYFAIRFARRHHGKWRDAQNHWEILVERFLNVEAFDRKFGTHHVMGQAVSATAYFLHTLSGECPECERERIGRGKVNVNDRG